MGTGDLEIFKAAPPEAVLAGCVQVYVGAFGQAPYGETREQGEELRERVDRYAGRDGFRLPVVFGDDGRPAGFALGMIAHAGDWWRDQVAAAIGAAATERWVGTACLEIVHVAVMPGRQRQGTGRRLMSALTGPPQPATGLLSCHPEAVAAQRFYLSQGWQVISTEFRTRPDQLAFWVMGLDIPAGERGAAG
jgi:ribosomal protein S18 acetylase RimI-like enzyme